MGIFDGYDGAKGSAAEVAQWLHLPVVLVVSAKAVAYSVAPLIYGFRHFNPAISIVGVVFNFIASERQYQLLQQACKDAGVECLGYLSRNAALVVPGRHLGLTIEEQDSMEQLIERAAQEVEEHVDIDRLLALTRCEPMAAEKPLSQPNTVSEPAFRRIAVARDEAFNFTYRANIDTLRQMGQVCFFSPLRDKVLPACDFLYLPGGYPELFAEQLAANTSLRESIRSYAESDGRIFAECGGFMYLGEDIDGQPMCGVLPLQATMEDARLHLGYRQMAVCQEHLRGHEFHYSHLLDAQTVPPVYRLTSQCSAIGKPVDTSLYCYKNVVAGYTHWYWADDPQKLTLLFAPDKLGV